ncbi:MAG: flagellar basal body P-ring formation protein FlgA [Oxalobacter formigenes]|nr:flagellar basal body P-ring formation protein FlgA [Oxalobacter formigenes]
MSFFIRTALPQALLFFLAVAAGSFARAQSPLPQSPDELGLIAEQFLAEKTCGLPGRAEITVTPPDARLNLPACAKPVPYLSQGARLLGRTTVAIRCESPSAWRVMVRAHVRFYTAYLTAAKALPPGHVIQESDLALTEGDITAMRPGVLTGKKQAVGHTVARAIQPGSPVWAGQLRTPQAIQQGQNVRIVSRGRGFTISGDGYAVNNAAPGQVAKAKTAGGVLVRGIARANGIIEVDF